MPERIKMITDKVLKTLEYDKILKKLHIKSFSVLLIAQRSSTASAGLQHSSLVGVGDILCKASGNRYCFAAVL